MKLPNVSRFIPILLVLVAGCNDGADRATSSSKASTSSSASPSAAGTPVAAVEAATPKAPETAAKMAPTPGAVTRETELKEKPFTDAKTLARLPAKTSVVIIDRSGGWLRVTSSGKQGWVRMLQVSSQATASDSSTAKELESAAKVATGRSGSGNIVSTTGIRGLSEEQLREAKPNPEELKRLDANVVSKEQAATYARTHKLDRRQIAYLPEPH